MALVGHLMPALGDGLVHGRGGCQQALHLCQDTGAIHAGQVGGKGGIRGSQHAHMPFHAGHTCSIIQDRTSCVPWGQQKGKWCLGMTMMRPEKHRMSPAAGCGPSRWAGAQEGPHGSSLAPHAGPGEQSVPWEGGLPTGAAGLPAAQGSAGAFPPWEELLPQRAPASGTAGPRLSPCRSLRWHLHGWSGVAQVRAFVAT